MPKGDQILSKVILDNLKKEYFFLNNNTKK